MFLSSSRDHHCRRHHHHHHHHPTWHKWHSNVIFFWEQQINHLYTRLHMFFFQKIQNSKRVCLFSNIIVQGTIFSRISTPTFFVDRFSSKVPVNDTWSRTIRHRPRLGDSHDVASPQRCCRLCQQEPRQVGRMASMM